MDSSNSTRRQVVGAISLGVGAATIGLSKDTLAQQQRVPRFGFVRRVHGGVGSRIEESINGRRERTQEDIIRSIDNLAASEQNLISRDEAVILKNIVDELYASDADANLSFYRRAREWYESLEETLEETLEDVGATIAETFYSGIEYAQKLLGEMAWERVVGAISLVFWSALEGAAIGAQIGDRYARTRLGAILGILVGGGIGALHGITDALASQQDC